MVKISSERRRVLGWIATYIRVQGRIPTVRAISDSLGYRNPSSVQWHIDILVRDGYLVRIREQNRGKPGHFDLAPLALVNLEDMASEFTEADVLATGGHSSDDDLEAEVEALVANPVEYERRKEEARAWFHRKFVLRLDSQTA